MISNKFKNSVFTLIILLLCILSGCGKKEEELDTNNPKVIYTKEQEKISYGNTKTEIEKILGTESKEAITGIENYRAYDSNIQIKYREEESESTAVLFLIRSPEFITYKGIKVGDLWNNVKSQLDMVAQNRNFYSILFNEEEQIEIIGADHEDSFIMITYALTEKGIIESITINDIKAGKTLN